MEMIQQSVLSSFLYELEKISASTKEIARAAKRTNPRDLSGMKGLIQLLVDPTTTMAASMGGSAYYVPKTKRKAVGPLSKAFKKLEGEIVITQNPKNLSKTVFREAPPTSRKGRQAARDAIVLHEGFERKTVNKGRTDPDYLGDYHHASESDVIVPEMNLVNTLTGPGSEEVYNAFTAIRGPREYRRLRATISDLYGDRALQFTERGQKIPKAMRKAIERERLEAIERERRRI